MQERHSNRERYFKEQHLVTEKYVIPYINQVFQIDSTMTVAEIGCGEAGNLKPFSGFRVQSFWYRHCSSQN